MVYSRFCKLLRTAVSGNNEKVAFLVAQSRYDIRGHIGVNITHICKHWKLKTRDDVFKVGMKYSIHSCEQLLVWKPRVNMIIELQNGIDGFTFAEVKSMSDYVSNM